MMSTDFPGTVSFDRSFKSLPLMISLPDLKLFENFIVPAGFNGLLFFKVVHDNHHGSAALYRK